MFLLHGNFYTGINAQTGWNHIVMNYIGPKNGQGIRGYRDGTQVVSKKNKDSRSHSAGDGRITVGRRFTDRNQEYATVQVDELNFFNAALSSNHVQSVYNSA